MGMRWGFDLHRTRFEKGMDAGMNGLLTSAVADRRRFIKGAVALALGLVSFFVLAPLFSDPQTYAGVITSLDSKQTLVTEVMSGAMAASIGLSALPPTQMIGGKLADLSGYFVIILSAIILEKYLLVILGKAAFMVLVPLACAMIIVHLVRPNEVLRAYASKILVFALAMVLIIPVSVAAADFVSDTYGSLTAVSLEEDVTDTDGPAADQGEVDFWSDPLAGIQNMVSDAGDALDSAKAEAESMMNRFVEQIAVFVVTTCILPILILLFFLWTVKAIFKVNVSMPTNISMEKNPLRKVPSAVAERSNTKKGE